MLYRYSPDRKAEHPKADLKPFTGVLEADGYGGFEGLYEGGHVVEPACRLSRQAALLGSVCRFFGMTFSSSIRTHRGFGSIQRGQATPSQAMLRRPSNRQRRRSGFGTLDGMETDV